ncbi:MAG: hypothetical protein VKJ06_06635 [Vampirovibrionales bacterium]|nr:hypothetical protein [Vampirovibrionales bacterium]
MSWTNLLFEPAVTGSTANKLKGVSTETVAELLDQVQNAINLPDAVQDTFEKAVQQTSEKGTDVIKNAGQDLTKKLTEEMQNFRKEAVWPLIPGAIALAAAGPVLGGLALLPAIIQFSRSEIRRASLPFAEKLSKELTEKGTEKLGKATKALVDDQALEASRMQLENVKDVLGDFFGKAFKIT